MQGRIYYRSAGVVGVGTFRSNFRLIFGYPVFLAVFGTLPMSIPVLSQN